MASSNDTARFTAPNIAAILGALPETESTGLLRTLGPAHRNHTAATTFPIGNVPTLPPTSQQLYLLNRGKPRLRLAEPGPFQSRHASRSWCGTFASGGSLSNRERVLRPATGGPTAAQDERIDFNRTTLERPCGGVRPS